MQSLNEGYRNTGDNDWGCCTAHMVKWCIGSGLFPPEDETPDDWERNAKALEAYQEVEPIFSQYRAGACYHEAGHVVLAYRYCHGIAWACVYKDGSGETAPDVVRYIATGFLQTTDVRIRKLIWIAAGLAAEQRYLKSVGLEDVVFDLEDNFCWTPDSEMMERIVDEMAPHEGAAITLHRTAHQWAKRTVEKDWHLIEQVDQHLLREGNYSAHDLPRIMKRKRFRSRRVFKMPGTYRVQDQRGAHRYRGLRVRGAGPLRLTPVATAFSIAQSPESSFRLGGPKVRRSRIPPLGLGRIGPQTLDVQARKLVRVVCFGEFKSGSGKPTLGGAKEVLPGNDYVALVEVAVPSLDQPFELR